MLKREECIIPMEISHLDLSIIETLGAGAFGTVFKANFQPVSFGAKVERFLVGARERRKGLAIECCFAR